MKGTGSDTLVQDETAVELARADALYLDKLRVKWACAGLDKNLDGMKGTGLDNLVQHDVWDVRRRRSRDHAWVWNSSNGPLVQK